ncbi:MAG TPA: aminotransferase class I/II-fold pyridoxal phosphate-dependent enzyme [Levilinea sp.]|nr:aminotransferase class I/II-fold pyridoxal phosphate-dependent enzyme [Levilinea sp.]
MTSNNTCIQPSDRIAPFKPYYFASINQTIAALKEQGRDVIRIDIGAPDMPPPDFIIQSMIASAQRADTHSYGPIGGPFDFKLAVAAYYDHRFGVKLDPHNQVLALIGSKEGIFHLSQVLINPGDIALVPDPGYPIYAASAKIAGGTIYPMPLLPENSFLPDFERIPENIARKAKIMWLNYPSNPTGAVASIEFFEQAVAFARRYGIVIANDAPYTDICFDGYSAPSILQVGGAEEIAVEFNSLAKTFNMAGWRLGMVCGNSQVISYLHTYKSQVDSSSFAPLFTGGIAALTGDQHWLVERNRVYQQRRDIVVAALRASGFSVNIPHAAIYVWARLPQQFSDAFSFTTRLLEAEGVSLTPGDLYGEYGRGHIRVSLGAATNRIEEAMQRLARWVSRPT